MQKHTERRWLRLKVQNSFLIEKLNKKWFFIPSYSLSCRLKQNGQKNFDKKARNFFPTQDIFKLWDSLLQDIVDVKFIYVKN